MLGLPISGNEQDWEIELADPTRVAEWLETLQGGNLGLELRSALALLVSHSLFDPTAPELTSRPLLQHFRAILHLDPEVRARLISYWSRDDWLTESSEVRLMLGQ